MTTDARPREVRRAFLLAGKASRLPGKFLLPIDGEPLIHREVRILRSCSLDVAIVSVAPLRILDVPTLPDRYNAGPLGGLATALAETDEPFFLFGADMPFLEARAIDSMRRSFDGRTLIPRSESGHLAVLHAVYSNVRLERVVPLLDRRGGLIDLVRDLDRTGSVRILPAGEIPERSFFDIDSPEDIARAGATGPLDGPSAPDNET